MVHLTPVTVGRQAITRTTCLTTDSLELKQHRWEARLIFGDCATSGFIRLFGTDGRSVEFQKHTRQQHLQKQIRGLQGLADLTLLIQNPHLHCRSILPCKRSVIEMATTNNQSEKHADANSC